MKELVVPTSPYIVSKTAQLDRIVDDVNRFEAQLDTTGVAFDVLWVESNGNKQLAHADRQMVSMMKGAAYGVYNELRGEGQQEIAKDVLKKHGIIFEKK